MAHRVRFGHTSEAPHRLSGLLGGGANCSVAGGLHDLIVPQILRVAHPESLILGPLMAPSLLVNIAVWNVHAPLLCKRTACSDAAAGGAEAKWTART